MLNNVISDTWLHELHGHYYGWGDLVLLTLIT